MQYKDKTKEQLINELAELHQGIENLEAEAAKRKKAEERIVENIRQLKGVKSVTSNLKVEEKK